MRNRLARPAEPLGIDDLEVATVPLTLAADQP
jgi:hypothetical protein